MTLDPIVTSAIIGFFGVVAGISGYALQNYYIKKSERETREYRIRRRLYDKFVRVLIEGFHTVLTRKEATSLDYKKRMDDVTNVLYLYASGDVIRALKKLHAHWELKEFQNLIFAMRSDLNIKKDLRASEVEWFRAT